MSTPFFYFLIFIVKYFFRAHSLDFKIFSGPTPLNLNIFVVINNDRSLNVILYSYIGPRKRSSGIRDSDFKHTRDSARIQI